MIHLKGRPSAGRVVIITAVYFATMFIVLVMAELSAAQQESEGDLAAILTRGLAAGGDLYDELKVRGNAPIQSASDARAIVAALRQFPREQPADNGTTSPLHWLVGLFQDVESAEAPAFAILHDQGLVELIRIFDAMKSQPAEDTADDLLFIAKILAMYGTAEGADRVVEAARIPLDAESYLWQVILDRFDGDHPQTDRVFRALADPLPPGFIAVSLLDAANAVALAGGEQPHPFDSPAGIERLRQWIVSDDVGEYSYAHSAAAALPFINADDRDELLKLACKHPSPTVRLEGAWATAETGDEAGVEMLAAACLDINLAAIASAYLTELKRTDAIPPAAQEPEFQARAEFAQWLAHPNELDRPPNKVDVIEHRRMMWPPQGEVLDLWLLKYRAADPWDLEADAEGVGMTGSTTWCFFEDSMLKLSPDDCIAIHCSWELQLDQYAAASMPRGDPLADWPHARVANAQLLKVIDVPPDWRYGRAQVALVAGSQNGAEGWGVVDGDDSHWYPASKFPQGFGAGDILMIHVGRRLLGLPVDVPRPRFENRPPAPFDAERAIGVFDKLLEECRTAPPGRRKQLLRWDSPLRSKLSSYAQWCEQTGRESQAAALVRAFQTMLSGVASLPAEQAAQAYGPFEIVDENFDAYAAALAELQRGDELRALVQELRSRWTNADDLLRLGSAAYDCGLNDLAEELLVQGRSTAADAPPAAKLSLLAKLWHTQGKTAEAKQLLLENLQRLKSLAATEIELLYGILEAYDAHRLAFLELFPDEAALLDRLGLGETAR